MANKPSMAALELEDLEQVNGGTKKFSVNDTRPVRCANCGEHFQAPFSAKTAKCEACGHVNKLQLMC